MSNKSTASIVSASFAAMLSMTAVNAVAATFTYSDPGCTAGFVISPQGVISCGGLVTQPPVCTPTPSPATTTVGSGLLFNANCTNSPTSYLWKVDAATVSGATQATYTSSTALPVGAHTVSVIATNGNGASTEVSVNLDVQNVTQAPACTISPQAASAGVGGSQLFNATCTNSPTSYAWKVDGSPVSGATTASYATATSLAAGSHTVAVTATNGIGTSQEVSGSLSIQNVASCAQANTNTPIDFVSGRGQNYRMAVNTNQSRSIQITTGAAGWSGNFMTEIDTTGQNVNKFMNVSTSQCDFSYTQFDTNNGCASTGQYLKVYYNVQAANSQAVAGTCSLLPNTTYYVNIRNEMVDTTTRSGSQRGIDTCPSGTICGFVYQMH